MWIIILILFLAIIIAGIWIGYHLKSHKITLINREEERLYIESINKLKIELANITKDIENKKVIFAELTEIEIAQKEKEIKIYYENRLREVNSNISLEEEKVRINFEELKLKYNTELNEIKKEIENFHAIRKSIIEEQRRAEELETKKDFYRVQLKDTDIEDIEKLKSFAPRLNNKELLNKLIFETYYRKPMTDLFNRIAGTRKPSGIYKITNQINGKIYIGRSVEIIPKRWTEHIKSSLNIGTISHSKIHDAIKENGLENFTFEILEEVPKDKLNEREKYWINFYETDKWGYNMKQGG